MMFLLDNTLKILTGISILGVLIVVHELGHFLLAKLFRVGVLEFAIGFGKQLWSKRIGETRYSLRMVPLGGYVRMVGDDPFQLSTEAEDRSYATDSGATSVSGDAKSIAGHGIQNVEIDDDPIVLAMKEDRSRWFLSKSYVPKMLIVLAGPVFNLAFAWIVAFLLYYSFGSERTINKAIIGGVEVGMPAALAGIKPGDEITAIAGVPVTTWEGLYDAVNKSEGSPLKLSVLRDSKGSKSIIDLVVTAKQQDANEAEAALVMHGQTKPRYRIGISPSSEPVKLGFQESLVAAWSHVYNISSMSLRSFGYLITGRISTKNLAGPISIIQTAGNTAEGGLRTMASFMIFLSVSLAILNLLPIPVLDGGHLVFFTIEKLKGSPVRIEAQQLAHQVGMVFLLLLMVFAVGNDILRIFSLNL